MLTLNETKQIPFWGFCSELKRCLPFIIITLLGCNGRSVGTVPGAPTASTVFAAGCFGKENIRAAFPGTLSVCPMQTNSTALVKRSSRLGGVRFSMQYWGIPKKDAALPTRVHWQGVRSWLGEFRGYPSIEYEADGPNVTNRLRGRTVLANGYLIEVVGQYQRPEDRSMVDAFINSLSIGKDR